MSGAVDLLGQERVNGSAPDIGAIEYYPSADEAFLAEFSAPVLSAKLSLSTTFTASISKYDIGDCTFAWDFGDGTPAQSGVGLATNAHTFASAGLFTVSLTVTPPAGSADAAQTVSRAGYILVIPGTCYVSPDGGNTPPYATWETAARSINDAYDVGSDRIVVTNGTYSLKALTVGRAVEIVSVEGASKTTFSSAEAGYNLVTLGAAVRDERQLLVLGCVRNAQFFMEFLAYFGGAQVRRWSYNVRRSLTKKLNNVFAQVSLKRANSLRS